MALDSEVMTGFRAGEIEAAMAERDQALTLPPRAYTDPLIYASEKEKLFRSGWMPVARVDQVSAPGDYLGLTLLDQPLLVVRGQDGVVRVLSNVCLHRAAPLVEGTGNRKLFTCPYHAWSYDTQGQLVRAPHMEGAHGFDEKDCRLPEVRSELWQGFILVNLEGDAAPFAPQVSTYTERFKGWQLERMAIARTISFDSPWNWKVLVDNFMEAYHHIATHSTTLEPLFHARDALTPDNDGPYSILHMPMAADADIFEGGFPLIAGLDAADAHDLFATVLFPSFLIAFQGNGATWYQILPQTHDRFELRTHVLVDRAQFDEAGFAENADGASALLSVIHQEDIEANDLVWAGLHAPLSRQGHLSPLEASIWQFNKWWVEKMGAR
ncbi:MAG: aromatic ring-hydroxylating dioxygenase subunit alpha [Parvibaculum sp.]